MAALEAATASVIKETGVQARLVLCTLRHNSAAQSMETVLLAEHFKNTLVAGFDIAADEAGFPITNHISALGMQKKGASIAPPTPARQRVQKVWETLEHFGPSRIGHGVRSMGDPKLVEHLRKRKIHLEICPSCNVQTGLYEIYSGHPINRLYKAGVSLSVSTDAPTIVNITLTEEYEKPASVFGWEAANFYKCNVYALEAAFLPAAVKQELLGKLKVGMGWDSSSDLWYLPKLTLS